MIYQIRSVISGLMILIGLVHIGFVFPLDATDINQLWFIGSGLALILSGLLNIAAIVNCVQRWLSYMTITANLLMLGLFIYAMQALQEPQVYAGIGLYLVAVVLHAVQLIPRKPYQQYTHPPVTANADFRETLSETEVVPVLRIFEKAKALEFYVDWLDFSIDWEHRFAENMPLYMQVSKAGIILHLSEHHGDASPGAKVYITCAGLREFHQQLTGKNYTYTHPALETASWGTLEMNLHDPFGNQLLFTERQEKKVTAAL